MHEILLSIRAMTARTHLPLCAKTQIHWEGEVTLLKTQPLLLWSLRGQRRVEESVAVKRDLLRRLFSTSYLPAELGRSVNREWYENNNTILKWHAKSTLLMWMSTYQKRWQKHLVRAWSLRYLNSSLSASLCPLPTAGSSSAYTG